MSNKLKKRNANTNSLNDGKEPKVTTQETAVAKYLRFNNPHKIGKLGGEIHVQYFYGDSIIDFLLASKFSDEKNHKKSFVTDSRDKWAEFMDTLLVKGFFHRSCKVIVKKTKPKKVQDQTTTDSPSVKNSLDKKESDGTPLPKSPKKKKKRAPKLDMHDNQIFIDSHDGLYVWTYDPIDPKNLMYGIGIVCVVIACCLYPLWPPQVRTGAYYLSLASCGLLGLFLGLGVFRWIFFGLAWLVTFGKHHIWIYPNLFADCGVLESFQPWVDHKVYGKDGKEIVSKKSHEESKADADVKDQDEKSKLEESEEEQQDGGKDDNDEDKSEEKVE